VLGKVKGWSLRHPHAGFSLLELILACALFGLLALAASSTLGQLATQFALDNGTRTAAMGLHQARIQAITRGRTMLVTFGAAAFTVTDQVSNQTVATIWLPSHATLSASSNMVFTPLGTVTAPVAVTVRSGKYSRTVSVGLMGLPQVS
jgi:prepilin-type N-terminal cleavage/methylation domain-containing protein